MTRLTINIKNIADKKACVNAVQQLFTAIEEHHGQIEAHRVWRHIFGTPSHRARMKLREALFGLEYGDQRLIFEYYAMAKPSKERLAKDLANKNAPLHEKWRDWTAAQREWLDRYREDLRREGEAIHLARKSGQQPPLSIIPAGPSKPAGLFGPRGTTDWQTMLQQIKRVFRKYPEACVAVSDMPIKMREEERSKVEAFCRMATAAQMTGGRSIRIGGGTRSKR